MTKIERIKKRHLLRKKEQRELIETLQSELGELSLDPQEKMEAGVLDTGMRIIIMRDRVLFFETDGRFFPTLHALLNSLVRLPAVSVDMGAVKYVMNGADIMRPGITKIDDSVQKDGIVAVVDERHSKPLAVGIALFGASEMRALTKGKAIKTIHHINDDLWNFTR